MIKEENEDLSLSDCPPSKCEVPLPPDFQPLPPPQICPASSGEQPHKLTSRKRVRPNLYAPPTPAAPRRRGWPPKARFMPQISRQEMKTMNGDQVMDLVKLQHVANALHYMTGNQTAVDGTEVKSRFSDIDQNLVDTLKAIKKKHGDITLDCSLESEYMKTLVLLGICKVVQDLQTKQIKDIDIGTLDSYYTALKDAENMKVNVKWLCDRLDEIRDAVGLSDIAGLVSERNRRIENIDREKNELLRRKVELDRLKSEIQDIGDQLAQEAVMVKGLNKKINAQTSKSSEFQHMYAMDGLI